METDWTTGFGNAKSLDSWMTVKTLRNRSFTQHAETIPFFA
jgi:hypothetical protein